MEWMGKKGVWVDGDGAYRRRSGVHAGLAVASIDNRPIGSIRAAGLRGGQANLL